MQVRTKCKCYSKYIILDSVMLTDIFHLEMSGKRALEKMQLKIIELMTSRLV